LSTFQYYLQSRLDFIARIVTASFDYTEPLYLIKDVLEGFFQQGVLLDTLLSDKGFDGSRLVFKTTLNGKSHESSQRTMGEGFKCLNQDSLQDELVAIPGGVTGCDALYAILENILRNAAKYRDKLEVPVDKLELTLQLADAGEDYVVKISDNVASMMMENFRGLSGS
jgi:hypothetical protein